MLEKDRQILTLFREIVPHLNEINKEKLLSFGEGLRFAVQIQDEEISSTVKAVT